MQCRGVGGVREMGAQVQDCAGQQTGSRRSREESQEEYDASGAAEGATTGSTAIGRTQIERLWRRRTVGDAMREETGKRDTTG